MKNKAKSTGDKRDKDIKSEEHENQNIHDFNPSQFVEEGDVDKKKKKSNLKKDNEGKKE